MIVKVEENLDIYYQEPDFEGGDGSTGGSTDFKVTSF